MQRALNEVLHNALQALATSQRERVLSLAITKAAPDCVRVTIEDSGPGIAPDGIGRVFYPYYTTRSSVAGRGLGLNIAHSIVTSLGGSMDIASEPGERTRVSLRLPVSG